jgi:hypothetical protein
VTALVLRLARSSPRAARGLAILGRVLADQRGQAMAEYSTLTFAILIGAGAAGFAAKWSAFGNQSLVMAMYQALQTYVNSVNYALSLAPI